MRKKKLRILLDQDECIADCVGYWLKELNQRYNLSVKKEHIHDWKISKTLGLEKLTEEELYAPMEEPGFFRKLDIIPQSRQAIWHMTELGWEIILVTSLPDRMYNPGQKINDKMLWLATHFHEIIDLKNIVVTSRKDLVQGDILIDDAPHNLTTYPGPTLAFDRPWNQEVNANLRSNYWPEIPGMIARYFNVDI